MKITVYTDGGCRNHGNHLHQHVKATDKAAWAYLIHRPGQPSIVNTAGCYGATQNRMELSGVGFALHYLAHHGYQNNDIEVISDSTYVINTINQKWINKWVTNDWHNANHDPIKNQDLWQGIWQLIQQFDHLEFKWVKGHEHSIGNNFVDMKLNQTMDHMLGPNP